MKQNILQLNFTEQKKSNVSSGSKRFALQRIQIKNLCINVGYNHRHKYEIVLSLWETPTRE